MFDETLHNPEIKASEKIVEDIIPTKVLEVISEDKPGWLDIDLNKFVSKKLFVWIIATVLLFMNHITADHWMSISMGYIGVQSVVDLATAWKGK